MANVVYKCSKDKWGNPTWDSEKVKSLLDFEGNYYYLVDKSYGTSDFVGIITGMGCKAEVTTNKYLMNLIIEQSPKIMGDATVASAFGISDGGDAAAIEKDKATYEAG